jgi:hypothetical protein
MLRDADDFSLVLGGPLFQLLRRARLEDDAGMLLRRRILFFAAIGWLPLLLLSSLEGHLVAGGGVAVAFARDIDVHIKFLIVVPLLVMAELVVHQRMRPIARSFLDRNLIPEGELERFKQAIAAAFRLRNSVLAETLLVILVYGVGVLFVWRLYGALDTATWYAAPDAGGGRTLTLAGTWYAYVSLPVFQFLLVRWYFRLFVWSRFAWHVSRIELQLVPTHPDRLGGLGFLAGTASAFALLLFAHGTLLAAQIAGRIFYAGAALTDFKVEIGVVLGFLLCVVFLPLLVFTPQLARAKRQGAREYGTLAMRYAREFDNKWMRGGVPEGEPILGNSDIQSLADMAGSHDVVREMRVAPVTRDAVVQLAAAVLLPLVPLGLTMMPLEELLKTLFGIVF